MEYYESATYGLVCKSAFGIDLKQRGMMSKQELDILLSEVDFDESQSILEVGCGAGQIAAYICERTKSKLTGIDTDEGAIAWASRMCNDNHRLDYRIFDMRNASELDEKYDKILAIDSLYFLSDMQVDTFYSSLKKTISNLYMLLKDEKSELIVFWSELPFFEPKKKEPEYTQLGICLNELGYTYRAVDSTENEIALWTDYLNALNNHQQDFLGEGSAELFESSVNEAGFFIERAKSGKLFRNIYIITR